MNPWHVKNSFMFYFVFNMFKFSDENDLFAKNIRFLSAQDQLEQ